MLNEPSLLEHEIKITQEVLHKWNSLHSEKQRIVLFPLHWSTSAYPSTGKPAQLSINEQLVTKNDLLICIFGTRIGTPTDDFESGSVEEIEEHLKAGKSVMIFFKRSTADITKVDLDQLTKLNEFKKSIQNRALYFEYSETSEYKTMIEEKLQLHIYDNFIKEKSVDSIVNRTNSSTKIEESEFTADENQIIKQWSQSQNNISYSMSFIGDKKIYVIGDSQYDTNNPRKKAKMDDLLKRLLSLSFIEHEFNKNGVGIYKLTNKGYDYADTL